MVKNKWKRRYTSPVGSKRIQLWMPVSFNWDTLPSQYHLCFSKVFPFLGCRLFSGINLDNILNPNLPDWKPLKTWQGLNSPQDYFCSSPFLSCCGLCMCQPELGAMLGPVFVCTAAVSASYQDESWAYAEISLHLCSQPQQTVCKGAVSSRIAGSSAHSSSFPCSFCCWSSVTPGSDSRASSQCCWVAVTARNLLLTFLKYSRESKTPCFLFEEDDF